MQNFQGKMKNRENRKWRQHKALVRELFFEKTGEKMREKLTPNQRYDLYFDCIAMKCDDEIMQKIVKFLQKNAA